MHFRQVRPRGITARDIDRFRAGRGNYRRPRPLACRSHQHGWRSFTLSQAWAAYPAAAALLAGAACWPHGRFEARAEFARALDLAGDIVTDPRYDRRCLVEREHVVEGGNAIRFCRRHLEPLASVVQRAPADPADALVNGVQHGKQQVAFSRRAPTAL